MIEWLRWKLRSVGYDVVRFAPRTHGLARRRELLRYFGIEVVLDVGANAGQFGNELRRLGFKGRIVSFEPLNDAYALLEITARGDSRWDTVNVALGSEPASTEINVAGNSWSSSLLDMLPSHEVSAPKSGFTARQKVRVETLDRIFDHYCVRGQRVLLKIDTQGFERQVLLGAERVLPYVDSIQLELSLAPLYRDAPSFNEMHEYLERHGYTLVAVEPGFTDRTSGRLLQMDGMYHRFSEDERAGA